MPINRQIDRSKQPGKVSHWPEDNSLFGLAVAQKWYQHYLDEGKDQLGFAVAGASYRASAAGRCLRELQYERLGLPQTEPPTVADAWRFELGHMVHRELQDVVAELYPEAIVEDKARFELIEVDGEIFGATHIDLLVPEYDDDKQIVGWWVVEIKSISGYPYKLAATTFRGDPEGPKFAHQRQTALEARAAIEKGFNVLGGAIVYLSLELVSPDLADAVGVGGEIGRFMAEWRFSVDELEELADAQIADFHMVEQATNEGRLIQRIIPEYSTGLHDLVDPSEGEAEFDYDFPAVVADPENRGSYFIYGYDENEGAGQVIGGGNYWGCAYCSHRTRCATHPPTGKFE